MLNNGEVSTDHPQREHEDITFNRMTAGLMGFEIDYGAKSATPYAVVIKPTEGVSFEWCPACSRKHMRELELRIMSLGLGEEYEDKLYIDRRRAIISGMQEQIEEAVAKTSH